MSSARSVAIVSILVPMLAACGFFEEEGPDCGCPTVDGHPQGTFESISGGRRVTITGDIVEVREPDGRTARYRFKPLRTSTDERIIDCGERPQANGLRTFDITSTSTSSTLRVLAEPSNRFAYVASALVPDYPSETSVASGGSSIEVRIDLSSGQSSDNTFSVFLGWTLETATGELLNEEIELDLTRMVDCRRTPCVAVGPALLPENIGCF